MMHDASAQWISQHIGNRPETIPKGQENEIKESLFLGEQQNLQKPINSQDEGDVFSRQAKGIEDHDHCNNTGLRDASSANTGSRSGDADSHDTSYSQLDTAHLRDENCGHSFVQGRAVHVDGRTNRHNETSHTGVDMIFLLQAA